jgi:hypothetical protein
MRQLLALSLFPMLTNAKWVPQILPPTWYSLVDLARWCPSVHNLQPHRVKVVNATHAELYYEPSSLLPIGDPDCVFATLAMGVFIEHLRIAAAATRFTVEVEKVYDKMAVHATKPTLFARLKLVPGTLVEPLAPHLITQRRTSRHGYLSKPLAAKAIDDSTSAFARYGHTMHRSSDGDLINTVLALNQHTLFQDLNSDANRVELISILRFNKYDAQRKATGLWSRCMGFPGALMHDVFANHQRWTHGAPARFLRQIYNRSFTHTSTICLVNGKFSNADDWLTAGYAMARMWLHMSKHGAYIQPFGSLITNDNAYKTIKDVLPSDGNGNLWMLFRAGYSKTPARSMRLSAKNILIN